MSAADLSVRLARLEARAEIIARMQAYADAADRKYAARGGREAPDVVAAAARDQAACFTPDAVWAGGRFGGDLVGRDAIEAFFRASPWRFTAHHYGAAAVSFAADPDGDRPGEVARACWRLLELGVREADGHVLLLSGAVEQDWRLLDREGWRIARMRFSRLHAVTLSSDPAALHCLIPSGESL